ncbi:MAG: hypothetical protein DMF56_18410 [Acidobacteria bacterium]|nr:MAG: hypothetical protein DMF56_18410 [Acidobacteriota bacterium]
MRSIAICCLLFFACNGELPTEPRMEAREANVIAAGCPAQAAALDADAIVMKPNSVYTTTVRVCFPPAALPWDFLVGPPEIAEGRASIAAGQSSTTLTIFAKSPGIAAVTYSVPRFGHANSTGLIGRILVANSFKRRSASH